MQITYDDVLGGMSLGDLFRIAHDAVSLPTNGVETLPAGSLQQFIDDFHDGQMFKGDAKVRSQQLNGGTHPASTDLRRGVFLTGVASMRPYKDGRFDSMDSARISATGLKHLVRAFLQLNPNDLRCLFNSSDAIRSLFLHQTLTGALAEAHVASLITRAGYEVLFPTTDEDISFGIDFLVPFVNHPHGLVVQVKSNVDATGVEFVQIHAPGASKSETQSLHATQWSKATGFNTSYDLAYTPVLVYVGSTTQRRFEFDRVGEIEQTRAFITSLTG